MTKPIVRFNGGAVCLLIALITVDALQPIECREDETLFNRLNDETLQKEDVENLLDAVHDKDNVELGRVSVSKLLGIRNRTELDCRYDDLVEDNTMTYLYYHPKMNKGLHKFLQHYFDKLAKLCFDKLLEDVDADLRRHMNDDERDVAERFWLGFDPELTVSFKFWGRHREPVIDNMTSFVQDWKSRSSEEKKVELKSSCTELDNIVQQYISSDIWDAYSSWLEHENVPFGWIKVGMICSVYLTLLEEKPGEIADLNKRVEGKHTLTDIGYGVCLIVRY